MQTVSSTSPFLTHEEELPWFLWQKKTPVDELLQKEKTDSRYVLDKHINDEQSSPPVQPSVSNIQRHQYNAVLSRMDQASRKTGTYANWAT